MKLRKIPKDFIICDGMTGDLNMLEGLLLPVGLLGTIGISWLALKMFYFIRKNKKSDNYGNR